MKISFIILAMFLSACAGVRFVNILTNKNLNLYRLTLTAIEIFALGFIFRFSIFIY